MRTRARPGPRVNRAAWLVLLFVTGCATGKAAGPIDPFALPEVSEKLPTSVEAQIASAGAAHLGTLYRAEFNLDGVRRMRRVGERITRFCEWPNLVYQYEVLDTKQLQAVSLPDGSVFMTRGMLQVLETEDELASILAHEIAHVTHRHALKAYQRITSGGRIFGSTIAAMATSLVGMPVLGIQLVQRAGEQGYAPKQELQADVTALRYLRRAGYDVDAYPMALKKIVLHVHAHPDAAPAALSEWRTHPNLAERFRVIQEALERIKLEEPVLYQSGEASP